MSDGPSQPVIVKTESFSPAINKLIMSDGSTLYGCSWPGCKLTATKPPSVGAHHKIHTGKAAQRRRGERRPVTNGKEWQEKLLSILDQVQALVNEMDAYQEDLADVRRRAEMYDAIKGLLDE